MATPHPALHPAEAGLPPPSHDAAEHGQQVLAHLRELVAQAPAAGSGERTISFADFMQQVLYAPGLGYYTAGATKLGGAGDFVTAPELSPLFGATLADAFAPLGDSGVIELGAGTGKLARDFIAADPLRRAYAILELSADLQQRQQALLAGSGVQWLAQLPARIDGLVLANEVLDAVPCEVVRFANGRYEQARVAVNAEHFEWRWQPLLDGSLLAAAKHRLPPIEGYQSEINLAAEALVGTLASRLGDGALCFIDYGFPRREYYLAERRGGTLACHYQQRVHFDPLILAGLQDVTAHVDFTAMAEAAVDAGASVICYATQAQFLLHGGLLNRLQRMQFASDAAHANALNALQKLVSPAEMGELFKVLVVGKGEAVERLAELSAVDQCFRL